MINLYFNNSRLWQSTTQSITNKIQIQLNIILSNTTTFCRIQVVFIVVKINITIDYSGAINC